MIESMGRFLFRLLFIDFTSNSILKSCDKWWLAHTIPLCEIIFTAYDQSGSGRIPVSFHSESKSLDDSETCFKLKPNTRLIFANLQHVKVQAIFCIRTDTNRLKQYTLESTLQTNNLLAFHWLQTSPFEIKLSHNPCTEAE